MDSSLLHAGINSLESKVDSSPYQSETHDALIALLRAIDDPNRLYRAHMRRARYILPSPHDIATWEQDILKTQDPLLRNDLLERFWPRILLDYPISKYWAAYLRFALDSSTTNLNWLQIRVIIEEAQYLCAYNFEGSSDVWQHIFDYYKSMLSLAHKVASWPEVLEVYMNRLSLPHPDIEQTLCLLSELVLSHARQEYDQIMLKASKVAAVTQLKQRHIELAESNLIKDQPNSWQKYIEETARYAREWREISSLFCRFLSLEAAFNTDIDQQLDVWGSFINLIVTWDTEGPMLVALALALEKLMRAFPHSPRIYAEIITWSQLLPNSIDIVENCICRIESLGIMDLASANEIDAIVIALGVYYHRTNTETSSDTDLGSFAKLIPYYIDLAASRETIANICGLGVILSLLILRNEVDLAESMVRRIVQTYPDSCGAWLLGAKLYTTVHTDIPKVIRYFELALDRAPNQELIGQYQMYAAIHADAAQAIMAKRKCESAATTIDKPINLSLGEKTPGRESTANNSGTDAATKTGPAEPARSRENFCIKVTGVGHDVDQTDIVDFFADCGKVISCHKNQDHEALHYTLEFSSESEVFLALTKSFKVLKGHQVIVTRLLQSTLFVTNYPPTMRQDQIKTLFCGVGLVSSVRFPAQRPGHPSRRFCYIEYGDSSIAQAAVALYNEKELVDESTGKKYHLKVTVSRPDEKGSRKARFLDRKVRVTNLPFSLTNDQISKAFEKFGSIESINVPRIRRDRSASHHNDGVAMILYHECEDADRAASAGSVQVSGRQAKIHKQSLDPDHVVDLSGGNTLRIENLDETLTLEQCRAMIESKAGGVTLMQFGPEAGMATIQFKSGNEAGNAALLLENYSLGSKQIKVIPGSDSGQAITKPPKLMVPANLKRRRVV